MDRILVTEPIADEGLAALRAAAQVDFRTDLDKAGLLAILPEYDALVVRSGTKVTAEAPAWTISTSTRPPGAASW